MVMVMVMVMEFGAVPKTPQMNLIDYTERPAHQ